MQEAGILDGDTLVIDRSRQWKSNDIIARSQELKALNVPMGAPASKWKEILNQNQVREPAFQVHYTIPKWTGMPVGVGVATSKTLAKVANQLAKKTRLPVLLLDQKDIDHALRSLEVNEIWGTGNRLKVRLHALGIKTACQLPLCDVWLIRKHFHVMLEKTWRELRGEVCLALEEVRPKQEICTSRLFGRRISDFATVLDAIRHFVSVSSEKLRQQNSYAGALEVHLATDLFSYQPDHPSHHQQPYATRSLTNFSPTSSNAVLLKAAENILQGLWKKGRQYKKAGIVLRKILSVGDYHPTFLPESNPVEEPVGSVDGRPQS